MKCFQNDNAHIYLFINVTKRSESFFTQSWVNVFFWTNTENILLLTQPGSFQHFLFLCQKCIPQPLKNSSNLHESQELSGPKKLKSVKILRTKICVFTVTRSTLSIFTQNSNNHFCCLISSNVLFIQPLAFCRNWEQRR